MDRVERAGGVIIQCNQNRTRGMREVTVAAEAASARREIWNSLPSSFKAIKNNASCCFPHFLLHMCNMFKFNWKKRYHAKHSGRVGGGQGREEDRKHL